MWDCETDSMYNQYYSGQMDSFPHQALAVSKVLAVNKCHGHDI